MRFRPIFRSLLVLAFVLGWASPALANSLASWVWIWPGVVSIDPIFGLLPTVLAAFIERPFVSRAGVVEQPLFRSLRANLFSLFIGIPLAEFVLLIHSFVGLVLLALAGLVLSTLVELGYLAAVVRKQGGRLRWWWIAAGNVLSSAVLAVVSLTVLFLTENDPYLGRALIPYRDLFMLMHLATSFGMVTAALCGPVGSLLRAAFSANQYETAPEQVAGMGTADPVTPSAGFRQRVVCAQSASSSSEGGGLSNRETAADARLGATRSDRM